MLLPLLLAAAPAVESADLVISYSQDVYLPGQLLELELTAEPGTFGILGFDPQPGSLEIPGIGGTLGLGLSAEFIFTTFVVDANGTSELLCNVGCESALVGQPLFTQALGRSLVDDALCFSNVAVLDIQGACEGCTPGYWKNHPEDWAAAGYDQGQDFDTVFDVDFFDPDLTLGQAVDLGGGDANTLARHAVAALLSAGSPDVGYPLSTDDVIFLVQCAFTDGNVEEIKDRLEDINESFCPL